MKVFGADVGWKLGNTIDYPLELSALPLEDTRP
jgi:hypothetical protein